MTGNPFGQQTYLSKTSSISAKPSHGLCTFSLIKERKKTRTTDVNGDDLKSKRSRRKVSLFFYKDYYSAIIKIAWNGILYNLIAHHPILAHFGSALLPLVGVKKVRPNKNVEVASQKLCWTYFPSNLDHIRWHDAWLWHTLGCIDTFSFNNLSN